MNLSTFQSKYGNCLCKIDQRFDELDWLMQRFTELKPQRICEIGSWHGGTLYNWIRHSPAGAKVISVDINHTLLNNTLPTWENVPDEILDLKKLQLITGDSSSPEILAEFKKAMPVVDFMFIDGDHTYDGLLMDIKTFAPLVRPGGIVAFHDINPHSIETQEAGGHGVARIWAQIKEQTDYQCEEIHAGRDVSYGIGTIRVLSQPLDIQLKS